MAGLKPRDPMWTLQSAQAFVANLLPIVQTAGYQLGISGGVLIRGQSDKDLDLVVYPTDKNVQNVAALEEALVAYGLTKQFDREFVQAMWKKKFGSQDTKHVEVWRDTHKRRIDVFLLS